MLEIVEVLLVGGLIVELTVERVEGLKVERVEGITVERVVGPAENKI